MVSLKIQFIVHTEQGQISKKIFPFASDFALSVNEPLDVVEIVN